jgi:hypothetical protein
VSNPDYLRFFAIMTIEHLEDTLRVIESLRPNELVARVAGCRLLLARAAPLCALRDSGGLGSIYGRSGQSVNRALRYLPEEGAITARYGKVNVIALEMLRDLEAVGTTPDLSLGP